MKSTFLTITIFITVLFAGIPGCTVEPGSNIFKISITDADHTGIDGKPVYVTIFPGEGNIPLDVLESNSGTIDGNTCTITLDNSGEGYPGGTYKIRAHIDLLDDGLTLEKDFDYIAIVEVTGMGGSVNVILNGPWGTYFTAPVLISGTPLLTDGKTMYLALVSEGDYWGNYTYGEIDFPSPGGVQSIDCWAPDGTYEFLAFIDTNSNMADTGKPDSGDWVASQSVVVDNGAVPLLIWTSESWTELQ